MRPSGALFAAPYNIWAGRTFANGLTRSENKLRIKALYRDVLRLQINWFTREELDYAIPSYRQRFENNRHVTNMDDIDVLYQLARSEYRSRLHPEMYIPPTQEGGTKFMRNVPPPLEVCGDDVKLMRHDGNPMGTGFFERSSFHRRAMWSLVGEWWDSVRGRSKVAPGATCVTGTYDESLKTFTWEHTYGEEGLKKEAALVKEHKEEQKIHRLPPEVGYRYTDKDY